MFGITTSYWTALPALDAREDFGRARRSRLTAQVGHCITGRRSRERGPRWLLAPAAQAAGTARLEVVTLDSIVGTVEARTDFDARFRPASNRIRRRWVRNALEHRTGRALPPITLVRRPDGHHVIDGCHRVSVARARAPRHRGLRSATAPSTSSPRSTPCSTPPTRAARSPRSRA